ncbi:MAG: hypothetical protein A3I44_01820 [Candidatus Sungbacteria bacterium RIFCSPLOWO2_02_FULL_51_17]|nr:MAG: hypothetical protein A2676_02070 [Candidatus Sungbacteria bacterium RIFCSPHIGHO2_01_FULL_51_22]OHA05746.1 MAG: hypothetical protein A3B29_04040 [Candidatus Sungbacteria bacterium RIFCSPLOWO2_01_FULL_51_34]OHA10911.1 MAG: hypothetical protein A3I44_01820 [Candidatus Sungbacteria bacterium RIFCSPLOWO2_02_FULL_51_17]
MIPFATDYDRKMSCDEHQAFCANTRTFIMKTCTLCDKGSAMGGKRKLLRGHYNLTWRGRKYPNLQWARIPTGERKKICAKCLRTLAKT